MMTNRININIPKKLFLLISFFTILVLHVLQGQNSWGQEPIVKKIKTVSQADKLSPFPDLIIMIGDFLRKEIEKDNCNQYFEETMEGHPISMLSHVCDSWAHIIKTKISKNHPLRSPVKSTKTVFTKEDFSLSPFSSSLYDDSFYKHQLVFDPALKDGKETTPSSLPFSSVLKNGGDFNLDGFGLIKDKNYNSLARITTAPKVFQEETSARAIILITTVKVLRSELQKRIDTENDLDRSAGQGKVQYKDEDLDTGNKAIGYLDDILTKLEGKWGNKLKDSDLVLCARWGEHPIKKYSFDVMALPQELFETNFIQKNPLPYLPFLLNSVSVGGDRSTGLYYRSYNKDDSAFHNNLYIR